MKSKPGKIGAITAYAIAAAIASGLSIDAQAGTEFAGQWIGRRVFCDVPEIRGDFFPPESHFRWAQPADRQLFLSDHMALKPRSCSVESEPPVLRCSQGSSKCCFWPLRKSTNCTPVQDMEARAGGLVAARIGHHAFYRLCQVYRQHFDDFTGS